MSSKREEERNEKIIRGLMKLPPNRKCINCNSLGPQYVCTNFWTFVCMTCSGIHREFTHRVKSVSMAKFTSQEVEALQKGGNQRARETYLVHWDPQKQKQPNCSNAEKVREFIKHVYIDKKYATDKPPRDTQNLKHPEEDTRRASSYHSYSQSPPYDTQYEERRYGRQLPVLTRKPGSDRGLYDGKVSDFSSPSRFSDQALERSRASDFSVSSPIQSPNSLKDCRVRSPPTKENAERVCRTQRPTSSSSFGSFDSNSLSFKSNTSVTLADLVSAPEILPSKQYSNLTLQQSASGNFGGLDLFDTPYSPNNVTQSPPIDLFQLPEAPSKAPIDLFGPIAKSSVPNFRAQMPSKASSQLPQKSPPVDLFQLPESQSKAPMDLFEPTSKSSVPNFHVQKPSETTSQIPQQAPPVTASKKSQDKVVQKNEGWATFDFPPNRPPKPSFADAAPPDVPTGGSYIEKIDTLPMPNMVLQWSSFESGNIHEPNSIHNQWHGETCNANEPNRGGYIENVGSLPMLSTGQWPVFEGTAHDTLKHNLAYEPTSMNNQWHGESDNSQVSFTNSQLPWDAFGDLTKQLSHSSMQQIGQEVVGQAQFATMDQYLGDINETGLGGAVFESRPPVSTVPFHVEAYSHAIERKSSNPFDLSDDCDFQSGNMYLDMTSLQAALPTSQHPNSFVNDTSKSWFANDPSPHYIPAAHQGSLGYIGGPAAPNAQMSNVPTQEPLTSVGGNPFA